MAPVTVSLQCPAAFDYDDESRATAGTRWPVWMEDFNFFVDGTGITDKAQKLSVLLHVVGRAVREIYSTLKKDGDDFDAVVAALNNFFSSMKNTDYEIFQFSQAKQRETESVDDFIVRLRVAAKKCGFTTTADTEIKRVVISGCRSEKLRETILGQPDIKLIDIQTKARALEVTNVQAKVIDRAVKKEYGAKMDPVCSVRAKTPNSSRSDSNKSKNAPTKAREGQSGEKTCFACGYEYPHTGECPAKGRKCKACRKEGHFASSKYCKGKVNVVKASRSVESEDKSYLFANHGNGTHFRPMMEISIGETKVEALIDSGADENIMDEVTFKSLGQNVSMKPSKRSVYPYGGSRAIPLLGEITCDVRMNERVCSACFTVVKGDHGNLLSYKTSCMLAAFENKLFHNTALPKTACNQVKGFYASLMAKYPEVFTYRVGRLKNFEVKLHIDKEIRPVKQPYRRIPYHLLKATEEEFQELLANDVLEVPPGPVEWTSQPVVVEKEKKPGKVRITTDSRVANKAIIREKYVMPTVEEILYDLQGATVFSELDVNKAFHQLLLAEDSRDITTVETPNGPLRFKFLNMGIHNASEVFHHAMQTKVITNDGKEKLKGVRSMADNFIVHGKDRKEHDERLTALVKRLKEKGLTCSPENCKLGVEELEFFGIKLSKDGVAVTDDKVKALVEAGTPKNASELRSILGLAVYCSQHIPNLATIAAPLWDLTRDGVTFNWEAKHGTALGGIKKALIREALSYFRADWDTEVTVDASPVGLAGVLAQINPKNPKERKVILYKSRKLSEVEQRYSQVEKEALAVVWICEALYLYLCGRRFRLITDNRAVELIFKNPNSNPPLRIKRWALRLMGYDFEIVHKPGANNIADYLSRHPVGAPLLDDVDKIERHVNFISGHAIPKTMSREELVEHTSKDATLEVLKDVISGKRSFDDDGTTRDVKVDYGRIFSELSVTSDSLVMRGERLILPGSLQARAHVGHQGMTKTKSLLRTKVWFPKMDQKVNELVIGCFACQLEGGGSSAQPLQPSTMPEKAWTHLAMDFYGPLPNGHELMVVMDECSHNPWYEEVKTTAAEHVCPELEKLFAFVGVPKVLKTDNGPPFNGQHFKSFLESYGITHRKVTPEHPQANGQAESFMKNVGKVIRTAKAEGKDWHHALNMYAMSYRSTPHSSTGVPPSTLLFGENRTNRLPTVVEETKSSESMQKARENDARAKAKAKAYTDRKRQAKSHDLAVGDSVLFRQKRTSKTMPKFSEETFTVIAVKGPMISVKADNGREFTRDASKFKRYTSSTPCDDVDWSRLAEGARAQTPETLEASQNLRRSNRERRPVQKYDAAAN